MLACACLSLLASERQQLDLRSGVWRWTWQEVGLDRPAEDAERWQGLGDLAGIWARCAGLADPLLQAEGSGRRIGRLTTAHWQDARAQCRWSPSTGVEEGWIEAPVGSSSAWLPLDQGVLRLPAKTAAWGALGIRGAVWAERLAGCLSSEQQGLLADLDGTIFWAITDDGALPGLLASWPRGTRLDAWAEGLLAKHGAQQLATDHWSIPVVGWWQVQVTRDAQRWSVDTGVGVDRLVDADGVAVLDDSVAVMSVDWARLTGVWEPVLGLGLSAGGMQGQSQRWWDLGDAWLPRHGQGSLRLWQDEERLRWRSEGLGAGPGLGMALWTAWRQGPMARAPLTVWGSNEELAVVRLKTLVEPAMRAATADLAALGLGQSRGGYRYAAFRRDDRWVVYAHPQLAGRSGRRTFALLDDGRIFSFVGLGGMPKSDDLWEGGDWSGEPRWAPCHWYVNNARIEELQ